MLDAHPELAIPAETNWGRAFRAFERGGVRSAVEAMVRDPQWKRFGMSADELTQRIEEERPTGFGEILRIFYRIYAEQRGKARWGDKTPFYSAGMVQIQDLLPEARFVHIVRDGRDVALSIVPLGFGPNSVTDAAEAWRQTLKSARSQAAELQFYTEIHYEELVCDTAAVLKGLCDFLDLEWNPSMLSYHRDAARKLSDETFDLHLPHRVVSKDERLAIHGLLESAPQLARVERWRSEMSADDVRAFELVAGRTLERHGYELGAVS